MTDVNGVHPSWAPRPVEPTNSVTPNAPAGAPEGVSDVVEVSTAAALAAKIQQIPDVRTDLVERVRHEIEGGAYETPERIEGAVGKLLNDLYPEHL